jgi:thiosulfate reductase / polysulfide reductase chain A
LVVGRTAVITQSSSQNNSLLQEFEPTNDLWIHPEPASRLAILHGDTVVVESAAGSQKIKANVTYQTRPDTVYMHTGFGVLSPALRNLKGKGASIAEVLEDEMDEITGNMAMHETIVTVRKEAA